MTEELKKRQKYAKNLFINLRVGDRVMAQFIAWDSIYNNHINSIIFNYRSDFGT